MAYNKVYQKIPYIEAGLQIRKRTLNEEKDVFSVKRYAINNLDKSNTAIPA